MFKLSRMDLLQETDAVFEPREVPMPDLSDEKIFPGGIRIRVLFAPEMKWRLMEEFGPDHLSEQDDGRLMLRAEYSDMDSLITWLMTFGDKAEILEPEEARTRLKEVIGNMVKIYDKKKI